MTGTTHSPFDRRFVPLAPGSRIKRGQIALVPGVTVPMMQFDLPAGVTGHAREQVARRQLKDRFGLQEDIVDMRPYAAGADAWDRALISDRAQVEGWRSSAGQARALLPDYLALPTCEGLWTIAASGDNIAVRCGPGDGFGTAPAMLDAMLTERLAAGETPKALLVLGAMDTARLAQHGVPVLTDPADVAKTGGLTKPETLAHNELTLDLLQDPALVRTRLRRSLQALVTPVVLAAIGAGLWVAANVTETTRLNEEHQTIAAATQEIVRARFVPEGPILDVRAQVSARIDAMQTAASGAEDVADAYTLFERASAILAASDGQLIRINSADGRALDLLIDAADFAAVDALLAALAANGLAVELIEARVSDQGGAVRTSLAITGEVAE
ncbi:MAG: type II secretion system protein GspL [Pseudomonadota bacterium]